MFDELRDLRNEPLFKLTKQEIQGRLALIGDETQRLTNELKELKDMSSVLCKRLHQLTEPVSTKRNIHKGYVDSSDFRTEFQGTRKISSEPVQNYAQQAISEAAHAAKVYQDCSKAAISARKFSVAPVKHYSTQTSAKATPRTSNADSMAESFLGKLDKSVEEDTKGSEDYYECHPAFTN